MPRLATDLLVVGHEAGQEGLQVEDGLGALLQAQGQTAGDAGHASEAVPVRGRRRMQSTPPKQKGPLGAGWQGCS